MRAPLSLPPDSAQNAHFCPRFVKNTAKACALL